jgi:hypothetical protein
VVYFYFYFLNSQTCDGQVIVNRRHARLHLHFLLRWNLLSSVLVHIVIRKKKKDIGADAEAAQQEAVFIIKCWLGWLADYLLLTIFSLVAFSR